METLPTGALTSDSTQGVGNKNLSASGQDNNKFLEASGAVVQETSQALRWFQDSNAQGRLHGCLLWAHAVLLGWRYSWLQPSARGVQGALCHLLLLFYNFAHS